MSILRSRNLPLIAFFAVLAVFGFGCTIISPSASISPGHGSMEVHPNTPVKIFLSGIGTQVKRLDVKANNNPVKATLDDDNTLRLNGRVGLSLDTQYKIDLSLKGLTGRTASRHFVINTVTTPRPIVTPNVQMVKFGEGIPIRWNIPVKGFQYELPPGFESRLRLGKDNRTGVIEVFNYEQGQQFEVKILDAVGSNGWRMVDRNPGYAQLVGTTRPIMADISPPDGEDCISRTAEITVTFSEEISNTDGAEKFLSVEPAVNGTWIWTQANQAKFTPAEGYAYETKVTIRVKGGPHSLRSPGGSFLSRNVESAFLTIPRKMIDVNLSTQSLTAIEMGNPVFSCLISSGKPGYSTPTGHYRIYAKDRITVMASAPGAAEPYYVPDVPYAMWVAGGVAIHGAYWHSAFGSVRSHGCINVSVSNAAWLFEWAPVGTPVYVHY